MNIFMGWDRTLAQLPDFLEAFVFVTIKVAFFGLIIALGLGVVFGIVYASKNKLLRAIIRIIVEFFQNTPILIIVFFIYIALPMTGIIIEDYLIAIITVGLYHAAYISEIIRSGIESIPKGQYEAAMSQGFSHTQTMVYVILPQTIRLVLPPITTQIVNLVKNTSILQVIAGGDLMYTVDIFAANTGITFAPYFIATLLYFAICFPLTCLSRYFEKRNEMGYVSKIETTQEVLIPEEGGSAI